MRKIFILLLILPFSVVLYGQLSADSTEIALKEDLTVFPVIITDRPTASVSSFTLPSKTFQIETGFIYENTKEVDVQYESWYVATTLLRYGIWDNFEVRLESLYQHNSYDFSDPELNSDSTVSGLGPVSLGFKVHVIDEKGIRPQIAIMGQGTLRHIGSDSFHPTYSYPTAKLSATHTLLPGFFLTYNAGFGYNGENADGFFLYSGLLAYSLNTRFSVFGEVYGTFDNGNLPNHRIDGGFVFLARNNLQFDLTAGMGFDEDVDKYFINTGVSWRIPK